MYVYLFAQYVKTLINFIFETKGYIFPKIFFKPIKYLFNASSYSYMLVFKDFFMFKGIHYT